MNDSEQLFNLIKKAIKATNTEQKINQNVIIMIVGFAFAGLSEYFSLSYVIWLIGMFVLIPSVFSVIVCLIAYTVNYCSKKIGN